MNAPVVRIGEIAQQIRGVTYDRSDASDSPGSGRVPILRAGNITDSGLIFDDLVYVSAQNVSPAQMIRRNDVVIAASSGSREIVGKAAQALEDFQGGFGAFCKVLRPSDAIDARYFGHYFRTAEYRTKISSLAAGININNLRNEHLNELEIRLPSRQEQRRIAGILDQAASLYAKRRTSVSLLHAVARSMFQHMLRNSQNEWPLQTVEQVAAPARGSIRTGPFGSQLLHGEFVDTGIAVLGIDNAVRNEFRWAGRRYITEEKYAKLSRYTVHPGDVLITIMGTCGRCAVVPDDIPTAINTKHLCCITLDHSKCLPEFLHSYFLWHPHARAYLTRAAKGAIMSGLNMAIIKDLPIPLPPIQLQREYVVRAKAIQKLDHTYDAHMSHLAALFASLQSRAFAGTL